jgi:hypothetical protein
VSQPQTSPLRRQQATTSGQRFEISTSPSQETMQAVPAEGKKDALHLIVIGPPGAGAQPFILFLILIIIIHRKSCCTFLPQFFL